MESPNLSEQPEKTIEMSSETIERDPPEAGGTLIIMQRHGNYNRETGHLTLDGKKDSLERSRGIIEDILDKIPAEERRNVNVMVVASPTIKNEGRRSMETADAVIESVKEVFAQQGIPEENILTEVPRSAEAIEEPRMLNDDTGFREFLANQYGHASKEFWQAFEEERHKEEREKRGAEGPVEMGDRFAYFTNVLARYARLFHSKHKAHPERLIVWNVSHYDTITTFFKNHVAAIPQEEYVPVAYDGGMSLMITANNEASIAIEGKTYPIELTKRGTGMKKDVEER